MREEAAKWRQEGLISEETWQVLVTRYGLERLTPPVLTFSAILYGVGGILVGLAVMTFVAANWPGLNKTTKLILLLALLIGSNTGGFYLWQYTPNFRRLGQGILLAAGLVLGAVIALVAQIFHLSGPVQDLFFFWSVGVLVVAISLRLLPLGVMGLILLGIGYMSYLVEGGVSATDWIGDGFPYISVLMLPLAYWLNSRVIFTMIVGLWVWSSWVVISGPLGLALPAVILWGYGDRFRLDDWGRKLCPTAQRMQPIARGISVFLVGFGLFIYAFRWSRDASGWDDARGSYLVVILLILAAYVILYHLLYRREPTTWGLLGTALVFAMVSLAPSGTADLPFYVLMVNTLLLLYGLGLMYLGIGQQRRGLFWLGLVLLCLQVISRMLEYETGLIPKAIGLGLCGLGLMGAGVGFERYLASAARGENP
ncbi:MAG: DUF2157 domain-containing protein [Gloeomargarita sp. GMQP_bins_25]